MDCSEIPSDSPVLIIEEATGRGLEHWHIEEAWGNRFVCQRREKQPGPFVDYAAVGFDNEGRPVDVLVRIKPFAVIVFHADSPLEKAILEELGIIQ